MDVLPSASASAEIRGASVDENRTLLTSRDAWRWLVEPGTGDSPLGSDVLVWQRWWSCFRENFG
jgi:hypothetical protein